MFLQIGLPRKDQDVHHMKNLRSIYRMLRVTFGVSSSPFLAMATVQHHATEVKNLYPEASREVLQNMYVDDCLTGADEVLDFCCTMLVYPEASREVLQNMYVDGCLTGADDEHRATELQQSLTEMMSCAAFNLTKWSSNSKDVLEHIEEKDRAPSSLFNFSEKEPMKALGICWGTDTDCFTFRIAQQILESKDPGTKRSLLSIASKIYDPMGLLTPFTIRAKILFQQRLWQRGLEWDDELPRDIKEEWRSWKSELYHLNSVNIPRCLVHTKGANTKGLYQQRLLNHFWKCWRSKYLHPLSVGKKWNKEEVTVKVGDVVWTRWPGTYSYTQNTKENIEQICTVVAPPRNEC
jgi:hypothetical protein